MNIKSVCVFGGSGFVGSHLVHLLSAARYRVRVPTRNRERAKHLITLPAVDVVNAELRDSASLEQLTNGMDAVINLIGILHGNKDKFEAIHVELPSRILEAGRKNGVKRFLQMSALHADPNGPSEYLRSKGRGAQRLTDSACGIPLTIFRPSLIFGRNDNFLNLFAKLHRYLPVIMLGSPDARFQPVCVEDVGRAFVLSLENEEIFGQSYDLCGPKTYTLRELVEYAGQATGYRRPIIGLGDRLSYLQALMMEWLPVNLLTRDNYYSLKVDSVCHCDFPRVFGFKPIPLEAIAPDYLGGSNAPRQRYYAYRARH
jgi:NADH dehydrogenase